MWREDHDRRRSRGRPPRRPGQPSRASGYILFGLLLGFTALTYLAVSSGSPSDVRHRPVILTTLATVTGPFTGSIARNGQGCCLAFSSRLVAICGPVLILCLIAQVVSLPSRRGREAVRLSLWSLGCLVWLLGGPALLLHAVS